MLDGKKSTAERIVYDALALLAERSDKDPVETLEARSKRSRRRSRSNPARRGATYQVPVRSPRAAARSRSAGWSSRPQPPREDDGPASRKRASDALSQQGGAYKRKDDITAWHRPTRPSPTTAGRRGASRRLCDGSHTPPLKKEASVPDLSVPTVFPGPRHRFNPAASDHIERHVWVVCCVVILGMIMSILDTTIVNVALNTLSKDLHSPLSQVQWVITGYLLGARRRDPRHRLGRAAVRRQAGLHGLAGAVHAGSALCGLADSVTSLVIFRILRARAVG